MATSDIINELLKDITDPTIRVDFVATFGLIKEAYVSGRIDDDKVKRYLMELVVDVLMLKNPDATIESIKEEAEMWTQRIYSVFRIMRLKKEAMMLHRQREFI